MIQKRGRESSKEMIKLENVQNLTEIPYEAFKWRKR